MALLKVLALGNQQIEAAQVGPATDVVARLRERQPLGQDTLWTELKRYSNACLTSRHIGRRCDLVIATISASAQVDQHTVPKPGPGSSDLR